MEADNGFIVFAKLFINQAEIEMGFGERRLSFDRSRKTLGGFVQFSFAHGLCGLRKFRGDRRVLRKDTVGRCREKQAKKGDCESSEWRYRCWRGKQGKHNPAHSQIL